MAKTHTKTAMLFARVDRAFWLRVQKAAAKCGVSASEWVRAAVEQRLNRQRDDR